MRNCPICGHKDPPWWRPRKSRVFCEYVKVDTLEWNNPDLFMKIKEAHPLPYDDGHFIYHITKKGLNVERIEIELYKFMKWGAEPQEYVDHSAMAFVQPLTDFMTRGDNDG